MKLNRKATIFLAIVEIFFAMILAVAVGAFLQIYKESYSISYLIFSILAIIAILLNSCRDVIADKLNK